MTEANVIATTAKINFKVANISKLNSTWSPEYSVQGIPWKVEVCKKVKKGNESLGIYLYCAKKEKPESWSHAAIATFKLLPFNDKTNPITNDSEPFVFDNSGLGVGKSSFIRWDELFDIGRGYVKDDTINLDISIEAADPDEIAKSKLVLENIESGCGDGCVITFRASVSNIESLIAARSSTFNMRKLPWDLTVYKSRSSMLSVSLELKNINQEISFKAKVRVKLMSTKGDEKAVEVTQEKSYEDASEFFRFDVISWDKLCKPENGFIDDNSIIMEVKIKMRNPPRQGENGAAANPKVGAMLLKMECSICLEVIRDQDVSSTKCGHLFCKGCIDESVKTHGKCPTCNANATLESLIRVYLPITN